MSQSLINRRFAERTSLADRLSTLERHRSPGLAPTTGIQRAGVIDHPYVAVGRERFDRVASAAAVEPRDPFLDRRVVTRCLTFPGEQTLLGGWPKAVLREAMEGHLPDAVRWRQGKEHLGWSFTTALMEGMRDWIQCRLEADLSIIAPYADVDAVRRSRDAYLASGDASCAHDVYDAAHLCCWLRDRLDRPRLPI